MPMIREKAVRNESLDRNAGRNVKRSADVSGSGRRFCFFEFEYLGFETKKSTTAKNAQKRTTPTPPLPFPPISITIELTRKRSFPYAQKSRSWL